MRGNYVSPEQIARARQVGTLDYLQRYEPNELTKDYVANGKPMHCKAGEYRTKTHDSLAVHGRWFYWWSRGFGGRSALDYLVKVKELPFQDAVRTLSGDAPALVQTSTVAQSAPQISQEQSEQKTLRLPPESKDRCRVVAYLSKTRGIDREVIAHCLRKRILYEDANHHNAVFPYLAGWAGDKDLKVLHDSLDRIRTQAVSNIDFLEGRLVKALAAEQAQDTYTVYQLKPSARRLMFMNMDYHIRRHEQVSIDNYQKVYTGPLDPKDTLEDLFSKLNRDEKPEGYAGHSLSVSDVVILNRDGASTAHFCDSVGFAEVPEFWKPITRGQKPMSLSERLAAARRAAEPKADPARNQAQKRPETAL